MGEGGEAVTDANLQTGSVPKKIVVEVTKPLTEEEIKALSPQERSDMTSLQQQKCLHAIMKPVDLAYMESNGGSIMPTTNTHLPSFEVPEPQNDITLDSRLEAYFEASRMYHESEANEPGKDKKDVQWERGLAAEYKIAAEAIHRGVADPKATRVLHKHLSDITLISGSSGADVMYQKKYKYAEKVLTLYEKKFPIVEEKRPTIGESGKAFFTSIAGRFGLKK
jgi:hypothetical protein